MEDITYAINTINEMLAGLNLKYNNLIKELKESEMNEEQRKTLHFAAEKYYFTIELFCELKTALQGVEDGK